MDRPTEPAAFAHFKLTDLPDDVIPMVTSQLDFGTAASMLATCRSIGDAVPAPPVGEWGPTTPVTAQVKIMSALLRSPEYDPPRNGGLELAAKHGWVEALPWLIKHGERWSDERIRQTARLELLQWARAQVPPAPWGATCSDAASAGHLELLQWARAQSPPATWTESTCSAAAEGGHLELLQWARAQNPPAPWNEDICRKAARGGHLELLQWARAQNPPAPWNEDVCREAARGGHLELLQWARWARAQNPPAPE